MRQSKAGIKALKKALNKAEKKAENKMTEDLFIEIQELRDGIRLLERGL